MVALISSVAHGISILCFTMIVVLSMFLRDTAWVDFVSAFYIFAAGMTMLASVTSAKRGGVDFLLAFFFLIFLAVPAWLQYVNNSFPWNPQMQPNYMSLAYGVMALSQLCYLLGVSLALRSHPPGMGNRAAEDSSIPSMVFYTKWAWGIAVFSILCAAVVGPGTLLSARFGGSESATGIRSQLLLIARSVSLLSFVMMIYLSRFAPTRHLRSQNFWAVLIFLPFFLVINYVPALPRFVLFGCLIAISCCFIDYRKPAVKLGIFLFANFFLIVVFPASKALGSARTNVLDVVDTIFNRMNTRIIVPYLLRVDFDGYMWIVQTIEYLDRGVGGIRWGYNFVGVIFFWVPRSIWTTKPWDTGSLIAYGLNFWYTNVANPLPAEALMAFGALGPVIVFGLCGYAFTRIEVAGGKPGHHSTRASSFFLYALLMGFIIIIMRGALNGVAPQFASGFFAFGVMMFARSQNVVWRRRAAPMQPAE